MCRRARVVALREHGGEALVECLHRRLDRNPESFDERGRLLGLLDVTFWSLRRLPSELQLNLDPHGHAARFLTEIATEPGLSNAQLAERLDVDITEVSRVGRKLLASGVAWKSRQWRYNCWNITPRGAAYLEQAGLAGRRSAAK